MLKRCCHLISELCPLKRSDWGGRYCGKTREYLMDSCNWNKAAIVPDNELLLNANISPRTSLDKDSGPQISSERWYWIRVPSIVPSQLMYYPQDQRGARRSMRRRHFSKPSSIYHGNLVMMILSGGVVPPSPKLKRSGGITVCSFPPRYPGESNRSRICRRV